MESKSAKTNRKKGASRATPSRSRAVGNRGIVSKILHPPSDGISIVSTPRALIAHLDKGLSVMEVDVLRTALGVPMSSLSSLLGVNRTTIQRRRESKQALSRDESDRVVRFARLTKLAIDVFEGEENARKWLNEPQQGLNGETPLNFARTEVGAREVENLLGRIEHGVYG